MITIPQGLISVYDALVLTALLITQIVLVTQIVLATRRDARERRVLLAKLRIEATRLEASQQASTPHDAVALTPLTTQGIPK